MRAWLLFFFLASEFVPQFIPSRSRRSQGATSRRVQGSASRRTVAATSRREQ